MAWCHIFHVLFLLISNLCRFICYNNSALYFRTLCDQVNEDGFFDLNDVFKRPRPHSGPLDFQSLFYLVRNNDSTIVWHARQRKILQYKYLSPFTGEWSVYHYAIERAANHDFILLKPLRPKAAYSIRFPRQQIHQLKSICTSSSPSIGYGHLAFQREPELCAVYDKKTIVDLDGIEELVVSQDNVMTRFYEIYPDYTLLKCALDGFPLSHLTVLIGKNESEGLSTPPTFEMELVHCRNLTITNQHRKFGKELYIYMKHACCLVDNPTTYHVYDGLNFIRDVPLERLIKGVELTIQAKYHAHIRILDDGPIVGLTLFKYDLQSMTQLYEHYGNYYVLEVADDFIIRLSNTTNIMYCFATTFQNNVIIWENEYLHNAWIHQRHDNVTISDGRGYDYSWTGDFISKIRCLLEGPIFNVFELPINRTLIAKKTFVNCGTQI